jgi:hypothetical protein
MKIDFKQFKKYTKIDKSDFVEIDVREMFADNIYNVTGVGIADLKLAEKIFSSDDNTEYSDEVNRVRHHAASLLPWFLAGLNDAMR